MNQIDLNYETVMALREIDRDDLADNFQKILADIDRLRSKKKSPFGWIGERTYECLAHGIAGVYDAQIGTHETRDKHTPLYLSDADAEYLESARNLVAATNRQLARPA